MYATIIIIIYLNTGLTSQHYYLNKEFNDEPHIIC